MNKKQSTKTKKDFMSRFTSLSEIVAKELKDPQFRKAYTEEMNRLQRAYEMRLIAQRQKHQ